MAVLVCALLAPTAVSEMSLQMISVPAWLASHHPDIRAAGAYMAKKELQQGIRRIMVYGLVHSRAPFREMERHGFEILFGEYTNWPTYLFMAWSRVRCGEECVAVHLAASGTTSRSASTLKSWMPIPSLFMACVPPGVNRLATARPWLLPAMEATAAAISDEAHR